ncbi:MAG: TlpA family protein disulfide reductase [Candidatus Bathyarchaeota archaeon]|nr:MAG: TlpA family protein disulfide reductase [Candidatus Bathyarchaeota archaeon]
MVRSPKALETFKHGASSTVYPRILSENALKIMESGKIMHAYDEHDGQEHKDSIQEITEKKVEKPMRRRATFVLLMVLGIVIVAVVSGLYLFEPSGEGRPIEVFTISDLSPITPPVDGHPGTFAQNFSLTHPNGTSSWLSDFRGKVVIIDFMAVRCPPCKLQLPQLRVIWEEDDYSDRIVLMSIDVDPTESVETLGTFAQGFPYATWIWAKDTVNLGRAYQVVYIPKVVIIDRDGYVRFSHIGVTYASTFIEEIDQLLG